MWGNSFSLQWVKACLKLHEPQRQKSYLLTCAPIEDSYQPACPRSLIRVFAIRMENLYILVYPKCPQWRLWSGTFFDDAVQIATVTWACVLDFYLEVIISQWSKISLRSCKLELVWDVRKNHALVNTRFPLESGSFRNGGEHLQSVTIWKPFTLVF